MLGSENVRFGSIILIVLVAASIVGTIVLASNYIHIKGVVKPLNVSVAYIEVDLGELMPLQDFSRMEWHNRTITTNVPCNVTIRMDVDSLTQEEIDALGNPMLEVFLRNSTTGQICGELNANLTGWWKPYNYSGTYPLDRGVYDVGVKITGRTGMPENETPIDFRMIITLRT